MNPPILIYDGRCGFCKIWMTYWRRLTGDRVIYAPSQEVGAQYPEISADEFKRSVWLVHPDGKRAGGAQAVFELMAMVPGKAWPLWIYRHVPGAAAIGETLYGFIARHRSLFYWITRILWGTEIEPASYRGVRAIFLRGLGLVYLIAFLSMLPQVSGLVGEHGILPLRDYLETIRSQYGTIRYWYFPTLAWLDSSDAVLHAMCWIGSALAVCLVIGIVPLFAVIGSFVLYLSLDTAGQAFFSFQWDALLLEAGFAAILLAPHGIWTRYARPPSTIGIWVVRLLLFRLMLESGLVKLLSGDTTWRGFTALSFHYETQPLPTPLAWYAHQLPATLQMLSVAGVFFVELIVPFLVFTPRRLRLAGAWIMIAFQLLIAATGNYTFFNLLTIVLCASWFDDLHLRRWFPVPGPKPVPVRHRLSLAAGGVLIAIGLSELLTMIGAVRTLPEPIASIVEQADVLHIVNRYGLFAVMTTTRPEIVIEGSNDGEDWQAYEFKFKAGDVTQAPHWVAPYQPRLDWQMWFAALSSYRDSPWFSQLMIRLLEGSPDVLGLLARNPFPGKPPRLIRAVTYDYHFSNPEVRRSSGAWWTRQYLGSYFPAVSLKP